MKSAIAALVATAATAITVNTVSDGNLDLTQVDASVEFSIKNSQKLNKIWEVTMLWTTAAKAATLNRKRIRKNVAINASSIKSS